MKTFKIAAPFVNIDEIKRLKDAGADELYCGYIDRKSEKHWPICFVTVNRRGKGQSFEDFITFKSAIEKADKYNLPVYVTMNGLYTAEQYPWLLKIINKISSLPGIKGLIVSDIGLFLTLKKIGYKKEIHISTGGTTFNYYTADFFGSLGANRIILDRQLTNNEIVDLISQRKTNIGIEIFIMSDPCLFIDGYCTFFHYINIRQNISEVSDSLSLIKSYNTSFVPSGCQEIMNLLSNKKFKVCSISPMRKNINSFKYQPKKYSLNCNLCCLYELKYFPDITLKVAGRGDDQTRVVKIISLAIQILNRKNIPRRQYQEKVKQLYFSFYKQKCNTSKCYCPSMFIQKVKRIESDKGGKGDDVFR